MKITFLLALLFSLYTVQASAQSSSAETEAQAFIYPDSTKQIIRGFGAANIVGWRSDMTNDEIETAFGTGVHQLGFSILRLRIPPNQNQWNVNLPSAQAAHNMGVKVFASPWSPPASMKTNNNTTGGRLKDDSYDDYAGYLHDFETYMADNGVPMYAISVQNEPDIEVGYESCDYTPEQMKRFVKDYADSIDTQLMAPESFQFRREMSDPLLNDPEAAANLDIVGAHIYGGGLSPYPLAEEKGKEVWMTEHYTESANSGNRWPMALDVGTEIHNTMASGYSAYVWWYIVRYYGPIGDGENGTTKGEITKRGYLMAQYSRFIRPGYVRIGATDNPQDNVFLTAYADTAASTDSARIIIVAVNDGAADVDQIIDLQDQALTGFNSHITSETQNTASWYDWEVADGELGVHLPGQSVTTFVSTSSVDPNNLYDKPVGNHLLVDIDTLDFGQVSTDSSVTLQAVIHNQYESSVELSVQHHQTGDFSYTVDPQTVESGDSTVVEVTYTPVTAGTVNETLHITTAPNVGTYNVYLNGTGMIGKPIVSADSLNFGAVELDNSRSQTLELINKGEVPFFINQIGHSSTEFSLEYDTAVTELAVNDTLEIAITFTPATTGLVMDTLNITHTASDEPLSIILVGEGTTATGLASGSAIPTSYTLQQNYPNPFNPSTSISYSLPQTGHVTLNVYDMLGRTVAILINDKIAAGQHSVRFDASKLPSGMYFYRLQAGDFVQTRQMTLVK